MEESWRKHIKLLHVHDGEKVTKVHTRDESVIDPAGRVFDYNDEIYRALEQGYVSIAKDILNLPVIDKIFESGLIETEFSDLEISAYPAVLKHRKIKFYGTYLEWAPNMIRDGAIMVAKLCRILYENGYSHKDGNIGNVMFDYTTPKFVDFGSIIPTTELAMKEFKFPWEFSGHYIQQWFGVLERCTNLTKSGISQIRELHKTDALSFFDVAVDYLESAEFKYDITEWKGYGIKPFNIENLNAKQQAFYDFMIELKGKSKTVLDIGANKGLFGLVAEELGFDVMSFDIDTYSIMQLYDVSKEHNKRVLPLVMDFMDPTPRVSGTPPALERMRCDVTLFLALMHHLCLRKNITFEQIVDRLDPLTGKFCIVEFIPLGDKHVGGWAKPPWYTLENFVNIMGQKGLQLVKQVPSEPLPRQMLLFERR